MKHTYKFKIDAQTFRKALYFNAFSRKRLQLVFVSVAWIGALVLACLNLFCGLQLTNVVQMCYIAVLLCVSLLIFSCERGWREYRDSGLSDRERTVAVSEDWVKLRISGDPESDKVEWRNVSAVYELADEFIIYRDAEQMVLLPKSVVAERDMPLLRDLFIRKLGRSFKQHCPEAARCA